jgi:hypothetical protein
VHLVRGALHEHGAVGEGDAEAADVAVGEDLGAVRPGGVRRLELVFERVND